LTHCWWEAAPGFRSGGTLFGKHAIPLKLISLITQDTFTDTRFFGAKSRCLAEQHERAQSLIDLLLWSERLLLIFFPVMGAFSAFATATRHGAPLQGS
jgi:hypothetical protein